MCLIDFLTGGRGTDHSVISCHNNVPNCKWLCDLPALEREPRALLGATIMGWRSLFSSSVEGRCQGSYGNPQNSSKVYIFVKEQFEYYICVAI